MSKELEALENLAKNVEGSEEYCFEHYKYDYNLTKSALERKEKLEKFYELVKTKKVNVEWLLETENVEEYNESLYNNLTEEEFNLLKEMLEDEKI